MKYFSSLVIIVVILLVGWSSNSSINLIFSKNTKITNFVPVSIKHSINQVKNNFIHSIVDTVAKDFSS